mmetsp:Transcript_94522/g.187307  ORF Transcript_94522/g.187307 Transcript_94522/m.187307 type:complete len:442 (-) Transcript_94522:30-1355(-)
MMARDRSRSPKATDMIEEIIRLVATREQARLQKDWALADTIRVQLTTMGVTLFDKSSSWKTSDGQTGRIPTFTEIDGGNIENIIQQQALEIQSAQVTLMMGGEADSQIKELVKQREQARSNKDFTRSDEIREELKQLGVEVYDKEKMWRAKNGASGVIIGWHSKTGPTDLEITTLVVQREKARQSSDWATSDMIRNELRAVGVEIYDKEKVWKVQDGRQGPVPSWQDCQPCQARGGMVMASPQMTPNMIAALGMQNMSLAIGGAANLQSQVLQAAIAASKDPASAALTLQLLQQQAAGGVAAVGGQSLMGGGAMASTGAMAGAGAMAGGAMAGRAMGGVMAGGAMATTMGGVGGSQSPEYQKAIEILNDIATSGRAAPDSEIEYLVGVREKLRQAKEFQTADEFRNMLRSTLRIELFEKEKRWQTSDGRQGAIPLWSDIMS